MFNVCEFYHIKKFAEICTTPHPPAVFVMHNFFSFHFLQTDTPARAVPGVIS